MLLPVGLTALEASAGFPLGCSANAGFPASRDKAPRAALELAVARALQQPPCVVSFSGGRDSALLLAVSSRVARSQGLELPIPVTLRYPHAPDTEETFWQEAVIAHLELPSWERIELTTELDFVGPVAAEQVLREKAPLYPANAHSVVPPADRARGGTVMVGIGGDELFSPHRWQPLNDVLARRRWPQVGDARRLAAAALSPGLRGWIDAARHDVSSELFWMRPEARRRVRRLLAETPDQPVRFDRAVARVTRMRYLELGLAAILRITRSREAELAVPLLDPRFVAALARARGRRGWSTRTAAMRALGSGLLRDEVLARSTKATFTGAFFTAATRAFAAHWSGEGLDSSLVDPAALRANWLGPKPDFRTAVLLQSAWLHDELARRPDARSLVRAA